MRKNFSLLIFIVVFLLIAGLSCFAQSDTNSSNSSNTKQEKLKNRPLKIKKKYPPKIPPNCMRLAENSTLYVRLKVTFHSSGQVTNVEVIQSSGCLDYDDESIKVTKLIKFEPAFKNGVEVTVVKEIAFNVMLQ